MVFSDKSAHCQNSLWKLESKLTNSEVFFVNVFVIPLSFKGLGVIVENLELQCWELILDSSASTVISYELSLH